MDQRTTSSTKTKRGPSDPSELLGRRWILWRGLDKRRLAAEIVQVRERYADLKERLGRAGVDAKDRELLQERLEVVRDKLVAAARQSLDSGDIDNGWKFLQELEREMVLVLDPMELDARFVSAMSEANKKLGDSWRGKATQRLMQRYREIGRVSARQRMLQEILFHLHSKHQNVYHKLGKLRSQLVFVVAIVVATLAIVLGLNFYGFFAPLGNDVGRTLWLAVVSGLTGGVLSVAASVVRTDPSRKIPEMSQSFIVTLIRPLVGATLALPLFFFIESGLLALGDPTNKRWVLLAFCFIGGFSERWFLGIVEGLGNRAQTGA